MTTKLIVQIRNMNSMFQLQEYGQITFYDDFINVVFIEADEKQRQLIEMLPFVENVQESRIGEVL